MTTNGTKGGATGIGPDSEPRRGLSRRTALSAGLAALATAGAADGGLVRSAASEAEVSLPATRLESEHLLEEVRFGSVRWIDAGARDGGLILQSTEISAYGPIAEATNGREVRGLMTANGAGSHGFVLRVYVEEPGTSPSRLSLIVGDGADEPMPATSAAASGVLYEAEATLEHGDVHLIDLDLTLPLVGTG